MPFASPGAQSAQPEIGVRLRVRDEGGSREAFARLRDNSRQTFDALNRSVASTRAHASTLASVAGLAVGGVEAVAHGVAGAVHTAVHGLGAAIGVVTGQLSDMAQTAGVTGIVVGAGIGGALHAVKEFVEGNQEGVRSLVRLSDQTGLSVESLSAMQAAVRLAGGETKEFDKSIQRLSENFFKSAAADAASNPFLHIGVATKDAEGKLRPFSEVFAETVHALAGIPNVAERGRAAFELFGESYRDVLDIISTERDEDGKVSTFETRLKAAYEHGTVIAAAGAKARMDLEADNAEIEEDLRDVGNTLATSFIPLTGAANPFVRWIAENKEAVKSFLVDLGSGLVHLREDISTIFSGKEIATEEAGKPKGGAKPASDDDDDDDDDGPSGGGSSGGGGAHLHFAFLTRAVPVIRGIRDVVTDVFDAIRGKAQLGDTVPALAQLMAAVRQLGLAFRDTVVSLGAFMHLTRADLPTVGDVLKAVTGAVRAFREGLKGGAGPSEFPLFQALGQTAREVLGAVGLLAAGLFANREAIAGFATGALHVLRDAFAGLRAVIAGGLVPQGNMFSWLNPLVPFVQRALRGIRDAFLDAFGDLTWDDVRAFAEAQADRVGRLIHSVADDVASAYGSIKGVIVGVMPYLRAVAKALGLKDAQGNGDVGQLVIAGLVLHFTGMFDVLFRCIFLFLQANVALGGLANALRLVGQIVYPVLSVVALALASLLGIPVWVAGVIVAAVIAAAAAIWWYWDDIKAGAHRANESIEGAFRSMASAVVTAMRTIWEVITAPFRWLWSIIVQIGRLFADTWRLITQHNAEAWAAFKADWAGLLDLFMAPIRAIGHAFEALWDKLKAGASATFGFLRRVLHLGGGEEEQETRAREEVESRGEIRRPEEQGPEYKGRVLGDEQFGPPAPAPDAAPQGKGVVERAKDWLTSKVAPAEEAAPGGAETMRQWFTRLSSGGKAPDDATRGIPEAALKGARDAGGGTISPERLAQLRQVFRREDDLPPTPDTSDMTDGDRYPTTDANREFFQKEQDRGIAYDKNDPVTNAALRFLYQDDHPDWRPGKPIDRSDLHGGDDDAPAAQVPAVDVSSAPTLDDLADDVGGSVSTARTGVDRGGALRDREPAAAGAPLTLVIGGQSIDGMTYQPSALEQLRAAQRASAVGGRAPIMRGSNY